MSRIYRKQFVSIIISFFLALVMVWYLFLKPYDYSASITSRTFPGAINQTLKLWLNTNKNNRNLNQKNLFYIENQFQFNDSIHEYQWEIIPLNDSTSKINLTIKDQDHSLINRLTAPFFNTNFEKRSKKTIVEFNNTLTEHLKKFKITVVDTIESLPETFCAYIPLRSLQSGKAKGMMQSYPILSTVLVDNKIKLNGSPFIEINKWNKETDSIAYNFCYPIIKTDSLPINTEIRYKTFKGIKALKAVYSGNYITSDRAWYVLLDHAKRNNIEVIEKPIEVFHTNPNIGGYEMDWKTDIYLPIKQ